MELRHIRYFLAVAEEKNISRAAARVGIGQPPLSLQIRDLEREVGTRLFHRIPQGVELTAAGTAFYELVRGMPVQVERAVAAALRAARGELGWLRVGFTASASFNPVVATAIRTFRRAYPNVDMSLEERQTTRLIDALNEGELDAIFLTTGEPYRFVPAGTEGLQRRLLSEEPLLAVVPTRHTAARQDKLKLAALRDEPFIMFPREAGPTLFDTVITSCRKVGFEPKIVQSAPQLTSIIQLVAAEMGVSLVPASMRQVQMKGVTFKELYDTTAVARLALAWRRSDASQCLKNFIATAVA
jgi:DNA-binding transcriptional LysR family regulator